MIALDKDFLVGSVPPIVTPFKNGAVDYDQYASLLEHQIANGTHGILVNGTSSEPSTLTIEEHNRLVEVAVTVVRGRIPVVAATGSQSHAETVALTEFAAKAGANALLVVTPYYIRPPQRGLVAFYEDIGRRTDLPLMIYHIPGRTAVSMELTTLQQIVERVPTLVGIKHAVNDLGLVTQMLAALGPQFRVFVGLEELSFPMMAIGACGLMNAVANVAPCKVAELANATAAGRRAAQGRPALSRHGTPPCTSPPPTPATRAAYSMQCRGRTTADRLDQLARRARRRQLGAVLVLQRHVGHASDGDVRLQPAGRPRREGHAGQRARHRRVRR